MNPILYTAAVKRKYKKRRSEIFLPCFHIQDQLFKRLGNCFYTVYHYPIITCQCIYQERKREKVKQLDSKSIYHVRWVGVERWVHTMFSNCRRIEEGLDVLCAVINHPVVPRLPTSNYQLGEMTRISWRESSTSYPLNEP